jgi:AF2212-like protein
MMNTVKAVVREGRIELLEQVNIPEGTEVLVTILSDEAEFWLQASASSLAAVWDNQEDDVYEQLLKR